MVFCLETRSDLMREKIVLVIENQNFSMFEAEGRESLEQLHIYHIGI